MFLLLFFCITQDVASISYTDYNNDIQGRPHERYYTIDKVNYNKNQIPTIELYKEDPSEFSNYEPRRIFQWIKRIINKNNTKIITPTNLSYEEVLNERIKFRQIEKNLTETLTKLSQVLTQILNIVSYTRHPSFDDLNELISTKVASKNILKRGKRPKRDRNGLNKSDLVIENSKANITDTFRRSQNSIGTKISTILQGEKVNEAKKVTIEKSEANNEDTTQNYEDISTKLESNVNTQKRFKRNIKESKNVAEVIEKSDGNNQVNVTDNTGNNKITRRIDVMHENFEKSSAFEALELEGNNNREKRFKRSVNETKIAAEKSESDDKIGSNRDSNKTGREDDINKSGRRAMTPIKSIVTNDVVKNRLLKYIDEAFADIVKKIDSLRQTKQMLSQDVNFRIGYIISNIDTLDVNMKNMKRDMEKNKFVWDDAKILNLYDTVKASNTAVTDLLGTLNDYIERV